MLCRRFNFRPTAAAAAVLLLSIHFVRKAVIRTPYICVKVNSAVTGPEWSRGFQEVNFPTLHDNGTGWW